MKISTINRVFIGFLGASALVLGGCQVASMANHPYHSNQYQSNIMMGGGQYHPNLHPSMGPVARPMLKKRKKRSLFGWLKGNSPSAYDPMILPQFQQWVEYEPVYRLYPGDQINVMVSSAPELSRDITVGPDGRIVMPMVQPIMAAGRTMQQVQMELKAHLARQLRDPSIAVTPRAYGPQQIFIGGQVGQSGTYTLPGPIGVLEAVMMAGGLRDSAKTNQIAVLRRAPNGGMMMRTVDIGHGMKHLPYYNDIIQLRRGDIIFVPRTRLAEIGGFMQAIRGAFPVDFNLSYQFGNNNGGTTVVSP